MNFASDNTGPVHPRVMDAMMRANEGHVPSYGAETAMEAITEQVRDLLDWPDAVVHLVATGTTANSLLLATLARPWRSVFCHPLAHINVDECNAPEFYTGGAKLVPVAGPGGKVAPEALQAALALHPDGVVHHAQAGPLSITQITETGTRYALDEIDALTGIATAHDLPVHMDGARFANAVAAEGCAPARMVQGVDALSFGGTKSGAMGVEAAVLRDPSLGWEFELRRKRAGHLFSKHRFLSAQFAAFLQDDLWLELGGAANAACARLAEGLRAIEGVTLHDAPGGNMIFADWSRGLHRKVKAAGAAYYLNGDMDAGAEDEALTARLVCNWSTTEDEVDTFLQALRAG